MNKLPEAIPYFEAAKKCPKGANKGQFGFIYTHEGAYGYWPRVQLARVKFQVGDIEGALREAEEALELQSNDEINAIHAEILRVKTKQKLHALSQRKKRPISSSLAPLERSMSGMRRGTRRKAMVVARLRRLKLQEICMRSLTAR
jgi:hypothetical protein